MAASPPELAGPPVARRNPISLARLIWAGPVVVVVAVAVNWAIKQVVQALDPSLARMGQLQEPLAVLTVEGAIAAVVVFALIAWLVPRPVFWFRVVSTVALLVSIVPDILLASGGDSTRTAMRVVGPLISLGMPGPSGPPPGGGGGGPPPGGPPAMSLERVGVLILLHVATFLVCVVLLPALTRRRVAPAPSRA
jgi:hypothetical protein